MVDKEIEQRVNIKFLVKLKKTATETFTVLREVYGKDALSRAHVFAWHKRFSDGREDVEDEEDLNIDEDTEMDINDEPNIKTEPDDLIHEASPNLILLREPKIEEAEVPVDCPTDGSEGAMPCVDGVNVDIVKQEPLSDEETSPATSVNESVDMKYEEFDVPVPFPVVVIEDKLSGHNVKEEAVLCGAASDTSSLRDEYIVGMKYESHHEPVMSHDNSREALGRVAGGDGRTSDTEDLCVEVQHSLRSHEESNAEATRSGQCDNGITCGADTRCTDTDSAESVCRRSFLHSRALTDLSMCRTGDLQIDSLKQHTTQAEDMSFKCDVCGKSFSESGDLNQHTLIHTPLKCGLCGKTFSQSRHLSQHIFTHTGEERFECEVCGKSFSQNRHLSRHMFSHTGKRPFKCDECGKSFARSEYLKKHFLTHTGEKLFKCEVCGKSFSQSGHLGSHIFTHTGEKRFKCDVCGKSFSHSGHLTRHILTHTGVKRFKCDECGKSFSQSENLKKHILIHTGEKHFKCGVCGKSFSQGEYLKKHILLHTGEKPFKCGVCGKSFSQSKQLGGHSCTDTGEKRFKCDKCGKSFSYSGHLTRHSLVHTGEKHFKCDECGKSFSQGENLKKHCLIHTSKEFFKCDECGKSFSQREYLKKHLLTHAQVK